MVVDFYYLKVNMIVNLVRDYFSIKEVANVGVLFSTETESLHIVCSYGMTGQNYSMKIDDLLEEDDVNTMLKMLVVQLKSID